MKNLFFIRSKTGMESWDYYDSKTEAVIFGDLSSYKYVADCLKNAIASNKCVHLDKIDPSTNSMQVVICPASSLAPEGPLLRTIERPIFWKGTANMQLVIAGNARGYDELANHFSGNECQANLEEDSHVHLDDETDSFLISRSVSWNIRLPLAVWDRKKLGKWERVIYRKSDDFVPKDIAYMFHDPIPYEDPDQSMMEAYLNKRSIRHRLDT